MKFYGATYWYPTPNNGLQEIGVSPPKFVTISHGVSWSVAWFNGATRYQVRSPHLEPSADPVDLQERLDSWAAKRQIKRCAIASR